MGDSGDGSDADSDRDSGDRLLLDAMLGTLATYLRMCGYDAAYVLDDGSDPGDDVLLERARAEERTVVTRDEHLARRADDAVLLASRAVTDQLREFAAAGFRVELDGDPTRCGSCNGRVGPVDPSASVPDYAPDPAERPLWRCRDCGQVFWKGSHWDDVARRVGGIGAESEE